MSNEAKEFYALMDKGPWALAKEVLALREREKVLVDFANAVERTYRELSDSPNSFMISMQCLLTQRAALMNDATQPKQVEMEQAVFGDEAAYKEKQSKKVHEKQNVDPQPASSQTTKRARAGREQ